MNWREPWVESKLHQTTMFATAACLGLLLVSPTWIASGGRWYAAVASVKQMQAQEQMTALLRSQTEHLQKSKTPAEFKRMDAQTLMALASNSALQFLRSSQDVHAPTPHLNALQVQRMSLRFDVQGSWADWLSWLDQWPTAAPGVTLSSLTLKTNSQGGLIVQMGAVVAQRGRQDDAMTSMSSDAQVEEVTGDPFDVQRWGQVKRHHAQSHPSYTQQVAPELLRVQEPLERYAREQLRYVGQISFGANVHALIRVHEPVGTKFSEVHRVRVGSHVGQNLGRVSRIDVDHLMLNEVKLASSGEWQRQEVRLPLQERMP
jgi:Tfp pilus assembly protein PilP